MISIQYLLESVYDIVACSNMKKLFMTDSFGVN